MKAKHVVGHGGQTLLATLLGVFLTCPVSPVWCPVVGAEEFKVGYVDVSRVFDEYERTKRSESNLEQKGKQKEGELERRVSELKKLREGLELLSDRARDARAREIDEKADELRRFGKYTQRELAMERDQVAREILNEIQNAIRDYATANGFSLVLDERLLLYGQEVYDITEEVLKQLNIRYGGRAKHEGP